MLFYDDIEKHVKHVKHAHPSHLKTKKTSKTHTIKNYGEKTTSFLNNDPVVVKGGRGRWRRRSNNHSHKNGKYGHHIRGGYRIINVVKRNKTRKL